MTLVVTSSPNNSVFFKFFFLWQFQEIWQQKVPQNEHHQVVITRSGFLQVQSHITGRFCAQFDSIDV